MPPVTSILLNLMVLFQMSPDQRATPHMILSHSMLLYFHNTFFCADIYFHVCHSTLPNKMFHKSRDFMKFITLSQVPSTPVIID